MTLLTALALLLAPVSATYALGLGSVFSDAEVEVSIVEQSKDGVVLRVHGTDYTGRDPGIEIALNPVGYRGSGTRNTFIKSVVIDPADPDDWTYEFTLDAAQVARLDPGTDYQIMTMRAEGHDVYDSSDSRAVGVPFDFEALSEPSSSPTPEEPSDDTGSSDGSGSGAGSGSGSGGGTSSGRPAGGDSGEEAGGDGDKPKGKAPKKPWTAPEEPPTTRGLTLTGLDDVSVDADEVIHAQASGFKPNETGIRVVVYSTPLVLSTSVKANGHGVAKWSGRLPKDIGLGKHTLTFQGSVNRGIRFVVTGTPSDGECAESSCAPAATSTVKTATPTEESGVGPLTWIIVAAMIVLGLVGAAVAMLAGRRKRDQEWDEPGYAQAPPRYPADPRHASDPYSAHARQQPQPRRQPQPQHETPLPRRLPEDQQSIRRQPGPRQPSRRQPVPQHAVPQHAAPQHREPQHAAPQQPTHRQPRPPESFAPPSQRAQAYEGQRVAGR
ncbi:hypothetical protein G5C66_06880 [Nocardioides sp. KC13]|uniref:Uncharacterized protein n=1 Tax=Nocardioides turkmenicus TaxID=2711220 RepID=A0A6M1QXD6_9ACTN|nr:hypothetical protein [Nocardioides sp. KC13]NGN92466.1 hypothetical protein [Nocardioides sp. KC13]